MYRYIEGHGVISNSYTVKCYLLKIKFTITITITIKIRDVFHKARQIFQVLTNYKQVSCYIGQHIFYEFHVFRAKILSIKLQRFYTSSVKH